MCVAEIPASQEAPFSEVVYRNLHIHSMLCKCLNELGISYVMWKLSQCSSTKARPELVKYNS